MIIKRIDFEKGAFADLYIVENTPEIDDQRKHPCMVVCPGGGYRFTSDREADPVARKFLAADYSVAVVRYSVAPERFPTALVQLAKTFAYLRENADELNIDPDRIFVQGGSAGGHLAASICVFWDKPFLKEATGKENDLFKPNGAILAYPVITSGEFAHEGSFRDLLGEDYDRCKEEQSLEFFVGPQTPPTYLWHTANDDDVPVENSLLYALALSKNKIPYELHIFKNGPHGLACCDICSATKGLEGLVDPICGQWLEESLEFLSKI